MGVAVAPTCRSWGGGCLREHILLLILFRPLGHPSFLGSPDTGFEKTDLPRPQPPDPRPQSCARCRGTGGTLQSSPVTSNPGSSFVGLSAVSPVSWGLQARSSGSVSCWLPIPAACRVQGSRALELVCIPRVPGPVASQKPLNGEEGRVWAEGSLGAGLHPGWPGAPREGTAGTDVPPPPSGLPLPLVCLSHLRPATRQGTQQPQPR